MWSARPGTTGGRARRGVRYLNGEAGGDDAEKRDGEGTGPGDNAVREAADGQMEHRVHVGHGGRRGTKLGFWLGGGGAAVVAASMPFGCVPE